LTAKLSAHGLSLLRGERLLIRDLDFALNPREMLLLEGKNGSGKTSLLRAMAGLLEFESGELLWDGASVRKQRQEFHGALTWLSHRTGLKGDLTLIENLRFENGLRAQRDIDFEGVLRRLGIERLTRLPLRALSAGQQRRVALARLLLTDAPLWLMDEPFTNLDREGRALVMELVSEHLAKDGMCVLAAHQDVQIDGTVVKVNLS
jgi:heme exporter protein A